MSRADESPRMAAIASLEAREAAVTETSSPTMAEKVRSLFPELRSELARLVAIPSVSASNFPEETRPALLEACDEVVALCRGVGAETHLLELPDTAPVVIGEIPAPEGAPTVLLYRVACFYLPPVWGFFALRWLERRRYL